MRTPILALLLLCFPFNVCADERPLITLAADEWCPYNCASASPRPGYVIELAREIYGRAGYRVTYRSVPWARALQSVRTGEMTAAIGATHDELPLARFPSEPIGRFHAYLFLPAHSDWRYCGPASLVGMRLGVINSYDYGVFNDVIAAQGDSERLVVLSGDDAIGRGLGMLIQGRIDVFVEDRNVALYTARRLGVDAQLQLGNPVSEPINLYLAFSQHHPAAAEYARLWSQGIDALRRNGRLAEILAAYGLEDWQGTTLPPSQ